MRKRLVQIALSVALLAVLVEVVLIAPSQIRDPVKVADANNASLIPTPEVPRAGAEGAQVDQSMLGMHMVGTQEGGKDWELGSDKAVSFKGKDTWELTKVKAVFFGDGGVTFTVTGKSGAVQVKSKNLKVEGDVVTRSSNGYVFRTHEMLYDSTTRDLTAPSHVDMVGPQDEQGHSLRLTGSRMHASLKESTMQVIGEVKAEKTLEGNRTAYIRSQKAFFSGKDRTAIFNGEVILDMDSMRITGPTAQFEYAEHGDTVKSVIFSGGARVSDSDKWATAQTVKVDFENNRYIFRGQPRVVQNNDELRGEEIVFLDGGKRVQIEGARAKVDEKRIGAKPEKVN